MLIPLLIEGGARVSSIDPIQGAAKAVKHYLGSILDRGTLEKSMEGVDLVVHIAAWHGFHEFVLPPGRG